MKTTRPPKMAYNFVLLLLAVLAARPASAYVLSGERWPNNKAIVMDLNLGVPGITLNDGSTTWDQVAEAALNVWNPYLGSGVHFVAQETTASPGQDDGVNQVFFDNTIYGEAFGDDTLAITLSSYNAATGIKDEADVIVNSAKPYNSYRGALEYSGNGTRLYDLRRVLIHEFGHVLGLAHVSQNTVSIMTPVTTDIDTIQADDIAGVQAIYGPQVAKPPEITGNLNAVVLPGRPFSYQIDATHYPTSYQASNLPGGLGVNTSTGVISGAPIVSGTYLITIGATNAIGTGTATLTLLVENLPAITSPKIARAYVGYPFVYRIAASDNPTSFTAMYLPYGLSLDEKIGVISGTPTTAGNTNVFLTATNASGNGTANLTLTIGTDDSLSLLHVFGNADDTEGFQLSTLFRTKDGNFYGTTRAGGGANAGTFFQFMPGDGSLKILYQFSNLGTLPYEPDSLAQAADGSFYGTSSKGGNDHVGAIFKLAADGTVVTLHSLVGSIYPPFPAATVLQARDGNYYGTIFTSTTVAGTISGVVYKLTPDGTFTTLHQFDASDAYSASALIQAADGDFYGTASGSATNYGMIYKVTATGVFTVLHNFTTHDGIYPVAPLLQARDGNFYGTAIQGGAVVGDEGGTVFRMTPGGAFTVLHDFVGAEGAYPTVALVQGFDGNLYGTNGQPGDLELSPGPETIFKVTLDGALTVLHTFVTGEAEAPCTPLIPNQDGTLYGGAATSETGFPGVIFKETPGATPPVPVAVTLAATTPKVTVGSGEVGVFTLTLASPQSVPITVYYTIKGSAINGTDYVFLNGKKKIKAGKTSKPINVAPLGDLGGEARKAVKIVLQPDPNYTVGTPLPAKVKIFGAQP